MLCETASLQIRGMDYLYIFKGVDLIYRGAGHRLDTFTAGPSQVQQPLSKRILLWPENVQ